MKAILAAVAILMGAMTPSAPVRVIQADRTLAPEVAATVHATRGGYLILARDPSRTDRLAHEACHIIQMERGDDMRRIRRVERECYRIQRRWAALYGPRGQVGHVPTGDGETPSGGNSDGPGGGSDGGSGGGGNSGHQDNGNHYGNDRPDNNSHDQNNKHNEAS